VSPKEARKAKLATMLRGLLKMYGPPKRRGTPSGLDMLVEAMLSQNTNMTNSTRGYRALRRALPTWTKVMIAPVGDVQRQIAICGLARMRARRLQALLRTIKETRGKLDIQFLKDESVDAGYTYLTSFHGIGPKTAAFVLLFAFRQPILPVDNGVLRVLKRLRLVRPKARDLEAERTLSPLIARGRHYESHVLLFRHAKERCRPKNPKCGECALLSICPHGQRRIRHAPPKIDEGDVRLPPPSKRPKMLSRFISAGLPKDAPVESD
jgi:endonuclease III